MKRSRAHIDGIRLMMQAALTFSLMALLVKFTSRSIPSGQIVFCRSAIGLILLIPIMAVKKVSFRGTFHIRLFFRGLCGFLALMLFFRAIQDLPLGTAVFLNYTSPFFVALFSAIWLKERIGADRIFWICVSFGGVYLLVNATLGSWNIAVLWGLLSAVLAAASYVLIRSIRQRESPLTIIFYFTLISTIGSAAWSAPGFIMPDLREALLLSGVGLTAFAAQWWLTVALRRAPASLISPLSYLTPMLSFVFGMLFWNEPLTFRAATGMALILTGGFFITHFGTLKKEALATDQRF